MTSNTPSSTSAFGATFMPPPKNRPFATATVLIVASTRSLRCRRTIELHALVLVRQRRARGREHERQPAELLAALVDQPIDDARHAERRDVREHAQRGLRRSCVVSSSLPTSIFFVWFAVITAAASASLGRDASVRRKSPPVPNGISAKLASGVIGLPASSKKPLTTSLIVPSPPIATMRSAPALQRLAREPRRVARALRDARRRTGTRGRASRRSRAIACRACRPATSG